MEKFFKEDHRLSEQEQEEKVEPTETFINGVLVPEIFKNYPEVRVGVASKAMLAGQERSRAARIMGDPKRFHNPVSTQEMGRRIGAARMIKDVLSVIYPESSADKELLRNVIKLKIVHGDNVMVIDGKFVEEMRSGLTQKSEKSQIEADACLTNLENVPLLIPAADCVPVVFYDQVGKVIGVAHSGRRGIFKNISVKVIKKMEEVYGSNPKDLLVYLGPHAGFGPTLSRESSYEVDREVYEEFVNSRRPDDSRRFSPAEIETMFKPNPSQPGHYFFDQGKAIYYSLLSAGVSKENIQISAYSTMANNDLFSSERKEGPTARGTFFVVAGLADLKSAK